MNPDHERLAEWDSAYVLGALSPADRTAYEEHLESCERCRNAVAEVSAMPGLLARLSPERAAALLGQEGETADAASIPSPALLDDLRREARRRRERRRQWSFALIAAVVALLFAAVAIPLTLGLGSDSGSSTAGSRSSTFEPVAEAPLVASATLTPVAWGTRIDLDCRYEAGEADAEGREWPYALYVVDREGEEREVSSWRASPGESARLEAGTALDLDDIASLEIRALGTGDVLMRSELD